MLGTAVGELNLQVSQDGNEPIKKWEMHGIVYSIRTISVLALYIT